ncbi:hypothetical protein BXU10_05875 [Flavobacterium sp. LM4]|nr:hypothetical protein BXU10_05875 [Flavobacterium sp. LM4]
MPEIGEEVLVGFEGSNAQNPYVLGTQYNGSETSGYADGQNNVKAIHTRSGIKFILNDGEGSILIEDPSGNTWKMDGQVNIDVNAPKNFTINAGGDISMTVGKNINSSAAMNICESAGVDKTTMVGMLYSTNVGGDHMLNVTGNFMENIEGNLESHSAKERQEVAVKGIETSSEGAINKHSKKESRFVNNRLG